MTLSTKRSFPKKTLHELVSHQITKDKGTKKADNAENILEDKEQSDNQENLNQVIKDTGLSPQECTKGRKGKVKVDKPTRSSARRGGKAYW